VVFLVGISSGYEHFHPKEVYYGLCLVPTGRKKDEYRRIGLFRTCDFSREAIDTGFSPTLTRHEIVYVEFGLNYLESGVWPGYEGLERE
jgi:hypothetical protein